MIRANSRQGQDRVTPRFSPSPLSSLLAPSDLQGGPGQALACKVLEEDDDEGQDDGEPAAPPQKGVTACTEHPQH